MERKVSGHLVTESRSAGGGPETWRGVTGVEAGRAGGGFARHGEVVLGLLGSKARAGALLERTVSRHLPFDTLLTDRILMDFRGGKREQGKALAHLLHSWGGRSDELDAAAGERRGLLHGRHILIGGDDNRISRGAQGIVPLEEENRRWIRNRRINATWQRGEEQRGDKDLSRGEA
jgi:hypothetical protein